MPFETLAEPGSKHDQKPENKNDQIAPHETEPNKADLIDWHNPELVEHVTNFIRAGIPVVDLSDEEIARLQTSFNTALEKGLPENKIREALMRKLQERFADDLNDFYFEFGDLFPMAFEKYKKALDSIAGAKKIQQKLESIFFNESPTIKIDLPDGHVAEFNFQEILKNSVTFFAAKSFELAMALPEEIKLSRNDVETIRKKALEGFDGMIVMPPYSMMRDYDESHPEFKGEIGISTPPGIVENTTEKKSYMDTLNMLLDKGDRPAKKPYIMMYKTEVKPGEDVSDNYELEDSFDLKKRDERLMNVYEYAIYWVQQKEQAAAKRWQLPPQETALLDYFEQNLKTGNSYYAVKMTNPSPHGDADIAVTVSDESSYNALRKKDRACVARRIVTFPVHNA